MVAWYLATLEIWVIGFSSKAPFFSLFLVSRCMALWFFKNQIFGVRNQLIFINISDMPSKAWDYHRMLQNCQPADQRKHAFCPTKREISRTNGSSPLIAINVWSCMVIRHQTTWRSISDQAPYIARRIPKDTAQLATRRAPWWPLNAVKWLVLWQVTAVNNSLFWTAQSKARKNELQFKAIIALNHVTPLIMEFKGD